MRAIRLDPGQLRHELVLQEPVRTADALGGASQSWSPVTTLWAHVETAASPRFRAGTEEAGITHRAILRADGRVRAGLRFLHGARVLAIRAVTDPDGTGRYVLCLTREEQP